MPPDLCAADRGQGQQGLPGALAIKPDASPALCHLSIDGRTYKEGRPPTGAIFQSAGHDEVPASREASGYMLMR